MFITVLQGKTTATMQNIYVVRGIPKALLGNPAIDALRLISRVESVEGATDEYHREFPDLFNGLGKMEGPCTITLKENAQPFAVNVPRRVALPLMEKTERELKRMEALGVISKVEQLTDWCAPMVVVSIRGRISWHLLAVPEYSRPKAYHIVLDVHFNLVLLGRRRS